MTIIAETEREGIWQCGRPALANCKAARTFPLSHRPSQFLYVQSHLFLKNVSTPKIPLSCITQTVYLNGFYSAVKFSSVIYNRRPITLPHLHMVRMNPNRSISQPCQLLPSTTCHQDIFCSNIRGNTLEIVWAVCFHQCPLIKSTFPQALPWSLQIKYRVNTPN